MIGDDAIEDPADFVELIDGLVERVSGVTHALILSTDGFPLVPSESLSEIEAEQLAAIAAGQLGLARNSASLFGKGDCELITIRLSRGYFLFMRIGEDDVLAVLTSAGCDMKVVVHEMTRLVDEIEPALTPKAQADLRRGAS